MMEPALGRLKTEEDFVRVRRQGARWRGRYFWLSFLISNQAGKRIGVVVSKKVSNKAVTRNLIRRRALSIVTGLWKKSPDLNGDLAITAMTEAAATNFQDLESDIAYSFERVTGKAKKNL